MAVLQLQAIRFEVKYCKWLNKQNFRCCIQPCFDYLTPTPYFRNLKSFLIYFQIKIKIPIPALPYPNAFCSYKAGNFLTFCGKIVSHNHFKRLIRS